MKSLFLILKTITFSEYSQLMQQVMRVLRCFREPGDKEVTSNQLHLKSACFLNLLNRLWNGFTQYLMTFFGYDHIIFNPNSSDLHIIFQLVVINEFPEFSLCLPQID